MNDFTLEELKNISEQCNLMRSVMDKLENMINNYCDPNCVHQIDKEAKRCKLCKLPSSSIPCIGGWL
jgi:hypothetical protein